MWVPDAKASRAVLIGAGSFRDPRLPDIPAVKANLRDLRRSLTHASRGLLAPEHCQVVADPSDQAGVGTALTRAVREADDLLLVYYCGHGLLDDDGLLHFALKGTDTEHVGFSAIHLDLIKRIVGGARAKARVLLLDCCFSGQAISAMTGESSLATGQLNLTGTYTLTSTTATAPSHAPPGKAYTSFTGALLRALDTPEALTLDEVHKYIDRELTGLGMPRPQRRSVGETGDLSLLRQPGAPKNRPRNNSLRSAEPPARKVLTATSATLGALLISAVVLVATWVYTHPPGEPKSGQSPQGHTRSDRPSKGAPQSGQSPEGKGDRPHKPPKHSQVTLSGHPQLCVDAKGNERKEGTPIQLWPCVDGLSGQIWTLTPEGHMQVSAKDAPPPGEACMNIAGPIENEAKVQLGSCRKGQAQEWKWTHRGELQIKDANYCLDDPKAATEKETELQLFRCLKVEFTQQWRDSEGK